MRLLLVPPCSRPLAGLAAGLLAACGTAAPPDAVVTRDSAGVRIVENARPVWRTASSWTIARAPSLEVGAPADSHPIGQVAGAVWLPAAGLVVADRQALTLRFHGSEGRLRSVAGGAGEGPGEFRALSAVARIHPDSVLAFDPLLRRVSIFDAGGVFARSFILPAASGLLSLAGAHSDGSTVFLSRGRIEPGQQRVPQILLRLHPNEDRFEEVVDVPGWELYFVQDRGRSVFRIRPFGRNGSVGVGPGGIVVGAADAYEVRRYRPEGGLSLVLRKAHRPVRVTRALRTSYEAAWVDEAPTQWARRSRLRNIRQGLDYPEEAPPYTRVMVDAEGNIWVRAFAPPRQEHVSWSVFRPDGRWLGDVDVPGSLEVLGITEERVIAKRTLTSGVETVAVHRLEKGAADNSGGRR